MRVLTVENIRELIHKMTLKNFTLELITQIKSDYTRWAEFEKSPRHAIYVADGVIELMPIADKEYYAFKYVNGHPNNPKNKKQTVVATGQLSSVENGYPILFSEMTVLTAIRTAATAALASQYLVRKDAKTFGIIGTGAQSEFQTLAHHFALGFEEIFYFDLDPSAMEKFAKNLEPYHLKLIPCKDGRSVVEKSDLITTATAQKGHKKVLESSWIQKGCHINGIGGDSPDKTELDPEILKTSKIVVELLEQSKIEGEIQQYPGEIYAELWELVGGQKKGREKEDEITLFDSVGFAIEDYSTLRLVQRLAEEYNIGHQLGMIPETPDPKNLFGVIA